MGGAVRRAIRAVLERNRARRCRRVALAKSCSRCSDGAVGSTDLERRAAPGGQRMRDRRCERVQQDRDDRDPASQSPRPDVAHASESIPTRFTSARWVSVCTPFSWWGTSLILSFSTTMYTWQHDGQPTMSTTVTIRLEDKVKDRVDRLAESPQRSKSFLAAEAIRGFVENNELQIAEVRAALKEADVAISHPRRMSRRSPRSGSE